MADADELWGGSLVSGSFDPVTWPLLFGVEAVLDGERHRYGLILDGVTEWRSARSVPLPWAYAELTEVHVSDAMGQVFVEMALWDDGTSLSARLRARSGRPTVVDLAVSGTRSSAANEPRRCRRWHAAESPRATTVSLAGLCSIEDAGSGLQFSVTRLDVLRDLSHYFNKGG